MSNQIGRNDLCPCMSGKKYKNCCLHNSEIINIFENSNMKYYDEAYMLKEVLQDMCFKSFFDDNRRLAPEKVYFGVSNNLGASMSYFSIFTEPKYEFGIINNKYAPIPKEKSLEVAHEIQHIINHVRNGYPSVSFKAQYINNNNIPCKNISDMLNDPMVNGEIMKYGFDMKSYFEKADKIQIPAIETFSGHIKNTFIITLCVKRYLDYKNIEPNINIEDIVFIKYCKEKYSSLEVFWLKIIAWIRQFGYKTKESASLILFNTIKLLGYEKYMELKYF